MLLAIVAPVFIYIKNFNDIKLSINIENFPDNCKGPLEKLGLKSNDMVVNFEKMGMLDQIAFTALLGNLVGIITADQIKQKERKAKLN